MNEKTEYVPILMGMRDSIGVHVKFEKCIITDTLGLYMYRYTIIQPYCVEA